MTTTTTTATENGLHLLHRRLPRSGWFRKRKRKLPPSLVAATTAKRTDEYQFGGSHWPPATMATMATKLAIIAIIVGAALAQQATLAAAATNESQPEASGWLAWLAAPFAGSGGGSGGHQDNENGGDSAAAAGQPAALTRIPQASGKLGGPTRLLAVAGQRVELQCPLLAASSPASEQLATVVWRKDGRPLGLSPRHRLNATSGALTIERAQPKLDDGAYECLPGGPSGGGGSELGADRQDSAKAAAPSSLQLALLLPPRLAPFECPQEAQVGMKLVLTCAALEGQQPMSFVWLKDEQIIWPSGNDNSNLNSHHNGRRSLAWLHKQQLDDKLALLSSPPQPEVAYSTQSLIESAATAGDEQERPLAMLPLDSGIRIRQADDYSILAIERLELKHSGRYTCSVQNEAARAAHSSQLNINAPPTLSVEPKDGDWVAGQTGQLDCLATGQPRPTVSWLRARESASTAAGQWDYVPVYENHRYSTLANGSLQIANITQREQGLYLCSAKNGFGPDVTKLVKITVHEPARFASKFRTLEVRVGERAELACQAQGELPIRIEWLDKESKAIQHNDKRFILDEGRSEPSALESRLILARSGRQDSGHYTCRAENKHGADKMVTNLLVLEEPHKVGELKVTNATSGTISLRWQLGFTGNAPITSYLVQYQSDDPLDDLLAANSLQEATAATNTNSKETSDTFAKLRSALEALNGLRNDQGLASAADEAIDRTLVELTVEQSGTSLVVKDLVPACLYRFRLAAINKVGLGNFSDWIRARTEEAPPAGAPTKLQASATGPNSVKVSWSPPERRSWNGQLIGFNIGYRPLDSNFELNKTLEWAAPTYQSMMMDAASQRRLSTTSKESMANSSELGGLRQHLRQLLALQQQELVAHLTNLQRSTTYLVWIQAANQRGLGPQSHSISVKTLDDVPPSAPAIKIQTSSASSITVAWSMLSNFVSSANHYSLFYRRLPPASSHQSRQPLPAATNSQQPTNSSTSSLPAAEMMFQSRDNNYQEAGPFIERTLSSQQLLANGNVFLGQDQLMTSNFMQQQQQHPVTGQHYQQFVYTLDQLECGSTYELYMTTRNSVGKSEPSSVVTTRTLGEPPQAPSNKQSLFARIGPQEVALNLAAWSSGGCPLTHVSLRYKQVPPPTAAANQQNGSIMAAAAAALVTYPITTSLPQSILSALNGLSAPTSKDISPIYLLKNLLPATCYELEVTVHNAAGHTAAQYEFVTAATNGSRGGLSRKESIFRLSPIDGQQQQLEQQATGGGAAGNSSQQASQLVPLVLMVLCFLCLIISSTFCYYRLADSWKRGGGGGSRQRRQSNSDAISCTTVGPKSMLGLHSGSPGSVEKSTMWRINGAAHVGTLRHPHHHHQHHPHHPDSDPDSPTNLHYCLRAADGNNGVGAQKSNFSQSVSMKDFNLIAGQPTAAAAAAASNAQTMNFKTYRPPQQHQQHRGAEAKAGTLRPRLFSPDANSSTAAAATAAATATVDNSYVTSNQVCSVYATTCAAAAAASKQKEEGGTYANQAAYEPASHLCAAGQHYRCNPQHQETSWTMGGNNNNYGAGAAKPQMENYAIPAGNYHQQDQALYDLNHHANGVPPPTLTQTAAGGQLDYVGGASNSEQNTYGQASIDACIQQLMEQQYQQQQYAMIVNQKQQAGELQQNRCVYGGESSSFANSSAEMHHQQQPSTGGGGQQQTKVSGGMNSGNQIGTQSIIDSSSSSSGIDMGIHLDCISNATSSNHSSNNRFGEPPPPSSSTACNPSIDLNNNHLFSTSTGHN